MVRERFGIHECTFQMEHYVSEMGDCTQCQQPTDWCWEGHLLIDRKLLIDRHQLIDRYLLIDSRHLLFDRHLLNDRYCKTLNLVTLNFRDSIYYIILTPFILASLLAGLSSTLKSHEMLNIHDPLFSQCHQGRKIHEIKGTRKKKSFTVTADWQSPASLLLSSLRYTCELLAVNCWTKTALRRSEIVVYCVGLHEVISFTMVR